MLWRSAFMFVLFRRHRIVSTGKKRIAAKNTKKRKDASFKCAVRFNGFYCIDRTGRIIFARRRKMRGYMLSVKSYECQKNFFHLVAKHTGLLRPNRKPVHFSFPQNIYENNASSAERGVCSYRCAVTPSSFKASSSIFSICVLLRYFVLLLATKTRSQFPFISLPLKTDCHAALITLLERFRSTAFPIFLLVVIPTRQTPALFFMA